MDTEIILIKARLNCAYCASDELFADWARLKDVSLSQLLKLFAVWHDWLTFCKLLIKQHEARASRSQEELLHRQAIRHEYQFLRFDFLNKFCFYVPKEDVVMAHIEQAQQHPLQYADDIIVMGAFLSWMGAKNVFDDAAIERLQSAYKKALAELEFVLENQ